MSSGFSSMTVPSTMTPPCILSRNQSAISRSVSASGTSTWAASSGIPSTSIDVVQQRLEIGPRQLARQLFDFLLRSPQFVLQALDALRQLLDGGARAAAATSSWRARIACIAASAPRPVTASMRRIPDPMPLFGGDEERADVAGAGDVRAAAQLLAERRVCLADAQHAHDVAVLLAEEGDDALAERVAVGFLPRATG